MTILNTYELSGYALDCAVAKAVHEHADTVEVCRIHNLQLICTVKHAVTAVNPLYHKRPYEVSKHWHLAGPIVEAHWREIHDELDSWRRPDLHLLDVAPSLTWMLRALVKSRLGDTVELDLPELETV